MKRKTLHIALFITAISYLIAGFHLHIHIAQPKTQTLCSQNLSSNQSPEEECKDKENCSICLVLSLNPPIFFPFTDFSGGQIRCGFVSPKAVQAPRRLHTGNGFDARAPPIFPFA